MKFLVDNQLPIALSRFLESEGLQARHVVDVQLDEASDRKIWQYRRSEKCLESNRRAFWKPRRFVVTLFI